MVTTLPARPDSNAFIPLLLLHARQGWLHMRASNWYWVRHVLWVLALALIGLLAYTGRWDRWPLAVVPLALGLQIWWRSFANVCMHMYVNRAVAFAPHTRTRLRWAVLLVGLVVGTLPALLLAQWGLGVGLLMLFTMCDLSGSLLDRSGRLNRAVPFMGAMIMMQGVLVQYGATVLKSAPFQATCAGLALALLGWSVHVAFPTGRDRIEQLRQLLGKAGNAKPVFSLPWRGRADKPAAQPAPRGTTALVLHVLGKPATLSASYGNVIWTVVALLVAVLMFRHRAGANLAALLVPMVGVTLSMLNGVHSAKLMERMVKTTREQALLTLAPHIPQGAALNRCLMTGLFMCWLRNALLLSAVALIFLAAVGGLGQVATVAAALSFMVYNVQAVLVDWSRRISIGTLKVSDVLALLQPLGLLGGFLYLSSQGLPMQWWWVAAFNLAYCAASLGWSWWRAPYRAPAWPCGGRV